MPTAPATDEKAWMLTTLKALAEMGMEMARDAQADARQAGGEAAAEASLRFSRVSRAVRQAVALYGLVLEDKLSVRGGERAAKPPSQKDIEKGASARKGAALFARYALKGMAPREALDAFDVEIDEWLEGKDFDHLYAGRIDEAIAEILLMLGLIVPNGKVYHDEQQGLLRAEAEGRAQPWRAAWAFLADRVRPHAALLEGWDVWQGQTPPFAHVKMASAEGP